MRIAFLVVDDRFDHPHPEPFFGSAPTALLQGFAALASPDPSILGHHPSANSTFHFPPSTFSAPEIHVICCGILPVPSPTKLSENVFYHQIILPKWSYLRALHSGPVIAIRKLLNEIQPDIIHAQGTERWCAIGAAFSHFPKVLTIHGNLRLINKVTPMEPIAYWKLQEWLETFSIPRYDGVVCITNYTQRNIADLAKKTWVVPNAVDLGFFEVGREKVESEKHKLEIDPTSGASPSFLDSRHSPPKVLVVGHVQPRKNQNSFIDAVTPLASQIPFEVRFFGGAARGIPFCDDFFSRVEARSWCSYGGMLGRAELREEFRKASLIVLPSLEDNCPMVVLEAMASGVPVIAPNVGGVPDLIRDGENGLLINPLSADSMRSAVSRLLSNPELAARLVRQARKDAEEKYHPRVIAQKHVEIYEEVVGAKKKRKVKS